MSSDKEQYLWDAEKYRKFSSQQKKWGRELISKLQLQGHESILDIGCGEGVLTAELAGLVPEGCVLGIDSSPEMIELARTTFPAEQYPNLSWKLKDVRELDFPSQFDVVFSNAVLHWITDHIPVLHGVKRSLKPGGRILFQMGGKGNAIEVIKVLLDTIPREEWREYFSDYTIPYGFYGPEEYTDWLVGVGLSPIRVELLPKDMAHKGRAGLAAWIRTTWLPFTQRIPEDRREDFIRKIVDSYVELHPAAGDGLVHVRAIRLEVEAENPG